MTFFEPVSDGSVLLYTKGVYRVASLYVRNRKLFAKHGTGFVRLLPHETTSSPNLKWRELDLPHPYIHEIKGCDVLLKTSLSKAA